MRKIHLQRWGYFFTRYRHMILRSFQIDEEFAEDDLEANLQRDKHARLCNSVNQLIDELTPAAPDFQLQEACNQLVSI